MLICFLFLLPSLFLVGAVSGTIISQGQYDVKEIGLAFPNSDSNLVKLTAIRISIHWNVSAELQKAFPIPTFSSESNIDAHFVCPSFIFKSICYNSKEPISIHSLDSKSTSSANCPDDQTSFDPLLDGSLLLLGSDGNLGNSIDNQYQSKLLTLILSSFSSSSNHHQIQQHDDVLVGFLVSRFSFTPRGGGGGEKNPGFQERIPLKEIPHCYFEIFRHPLDCHHDSLQQQNELGQGKTQIQPLPIPYPFVGRIHHLLPISLSDLILQRKEDDSINTSQLHSRSIQEASAAFRWFAQHRNPNELHCLRSISNTPSSFLQESEIPSIFIDNTNEKKKSQEEHITSTNPLEDSAEILADSFSEKRKPMYKAHVPMNEEASQRDLEDLTAVFFQTANRITSLIESGTATRQIFAVSADQIIEQAPPALASAIISVLAEPVIEIIIECLLPALMNFFVPVSTIGLAVPLQNVPEKNDFVQTTHAVPPSIDELSQEDENVQPSKNRINNTNNAEVFLQQEEQERTKGADEDIAFSINTPIKQKVGVTILNDILSDDVQQAAAVLESQLAPTLMLTLNKTITRSAARALTTTLTGSITYSLVRILGEILSQSVSNSASDVLTRSLSMTLSASLTSTLTQALSRRPVDDYYCYYCKHFDSYCPLCKQSLEKQYYNEYYSNYYLQYYTSWYFGALHRSRS